MADKYVSRFNISMVEILIGVKVIEVFKNLQQSKVEFHRIGKLIKHIELLSRPHMVNYLSLRIALDNLLDYRSFNTLDELNQANNLAFMQVVQYSLHIYCKGLLEDVVAESVEQRQASFLKERKGLAEFSHLSLCYR